MKYRFCWALLFFSFNVCFSNPSIAKIIGIDDREVKVPKQLAEIKRAIGLFNNPQFSCTAFCVSKDIVATNAHCIFDRNGKWRSSSKIYGYQRKIGTKLRLRSVVGVNADKRALNIVYGMREYPPTKGLIAHHDDWALVRIRPGTCSSPLSIKPIKKLLTATKGNKAGMLSIFYEKPKGGVFRPPVIRYSPRCRFVRSVPGLSKRGRRAFARDTKGRKKFLHSCDSEPGQSGSPILLQSSNNKVAAIAMNVGFQGYWDRKDGVRRQFFVNVATPVTAFNETLKRFANESIVDDVSFIGLQRKLKTLGFLRGKTTGKYDDAMRQAIFRFEKKAKLARLGLPTDLLMKKLGLK